jgi:tRNA pseudouridine38-40 synthase
VIAYDGTAFHGWQRQPRHRTVQGVLEVALGEVLGGGPARVMGAGRTDAGVHARGQVASFSAPTRLPAAAFPPLLERRLPPDVRVRDAFEAIPSFDARRSARARRYAYRLLHEDDVLLGRFAWAPRPRRPAEALERAARALEGTRDFSALRGAGATPGTPVCRVMRASVSVWEGGLRLDVIADHFLYHMVRNMVGSLLAAAAAPDPAEAMRAILASRDRSRAGVTAPAHGLTLEQVYYPAEVRA